LLQLEEQQRCGSDGAGQAEHAAKVKMEKCKIKKMEKELQGKEYEKVTKNREKEAKAWLRREQKEAKYKEIQA
jgi:hypothetical protein